MISFNRLQFVTNSQTSSMKIITSFFCILFQLLDCLQISLFNRTQIIYLEFSVFFKGFVHSLFMTYASSSVQNFFICSLNYTVQLLYIITHVHWFMVHCCDFCQIKICTDKIIQCLKFIFFKIVFCNNDIFFCWKIT